MKFLLVLSTCVLNLSNALAVPCPDEKISADGRWVTESFCETDRLSEERTIYDKKVLTKHIVYSEDGPISQKWWSIEGVATKHRKTEHVGLFRQVITEVDPNNEKIILEKYMVEKNEDEETLLKEWVLDKEKQRVRSIRYYYRGTKAPEKIEVVGQNGKIDKTYKFDYVDDNFKLKHIKSMTVFTEEGKQVGFYQEDIEFDIEGIIKKQFKEKEADRKLKIFKQSNRPAVAIFDTGFDISHPQLTYKIWSNPKDPIDGVDNDANGRIDDTHGWYVQNDPFFKIDRDTGNINESLFITLFDFPISHGTHVASVVMKDVEDFSWVGFGGDTSMTSNIDGLNKFLQKNNVPFVNLSLGFGNSRSPISPGEETFHSLGLLIKNNPESLFFVAAGNSAGSNRNLDIEKNADYPASFAFDNILVVGATNAAESIEAKLSEEKMAGFSKYGEKTVDLFAPGEGMLGAEAGGGEIRLSGTSMATPFVLNLALKIQSVNSGLSHKEIAEILMKTVYIKDLENPLPCRSGGTVYPKRALRVAKKTVGKKNYDLEKLILEVRKTETNTSGERNDKSYLNKLIEFWEKRNLSASNN